MIEWLARQVIASRTSAREQWANSSLKDKTIIRLQSLWWFLPTAVLPLLFFAFYIPQSQVSTWASGWMQAWFWVGVGVSVVGVVGVIINAGFVLYYGFRWWWTILGADEKASKRLRGQYTPREKALYTYLKADSMVVLSLMGGVVLVVAGLFIKSNIQYEVALETIDSADKLAGTISAYVLIVLGGGLMLVAAYYFFRKLAKADRVMEEAFEVVSEASSPDEANLFGPEAKDKE